MLCWYDDLMGWVICQNNFAEWLSETALLILKSGIEKQHLILVRKVFVDAYIFSK